MQASSGVLSMAGLQNVTGQKIRENSVLERAGMHRKGRVELKSVGSKAEPDFNEPTPASVVETIHKLLYLHLPGLSKSKKIGLFIIPWNKNLKNNKNKTFKISKIINLLII